MLVWFESAETLKAHDLSSENLKCSHSAGLPLSSEWQDTPLRQPLALQVCMQRTGQLCERVACRVEVVFNRSVWDPAKLWGSDRSCPYAWCPWICIAFLGSLACFLFTALLELGRQGFNYIFRIARWTWAWEVTFSHCCMHCREFCEKHLYYSVWGESSCLMLSSERKSPEIAQTFEV